MLLPLPATSALLIAPVSWSAAVAVAVRVRLAVALVLAIWVAREWRRNARPIQPRAARPTKTTKITTVGVCLKGEVTPVDGSKTNREAYIDRCRDGRSWVVSFG